MAMNYINRFSFLILGLFFICASCEELGIQPVETDKDETGTTILGKATNVFENPTVGDFSYFVRFESDTEFDQDNRLWRHSGVAYRKDTLLIEVVQKEGDKYLFRESYTEGSETYLKSSDPNSPQILAGSFWVTPTSEGWIVESAKETQEIISLLFGYNKGIELPKSKVGEFEDISLFLASLNWILQVCPLST